MACACSRNRATAAGIAPTGTYRVMVSGRKVYESGNKAAADAVAARFENPVVLAPGQSA